MKIFIPLLSLVVLLGVNTRAADDDLDHNHGHGDATGTPERAVDVWKEIKSLEATLAKTIAAKKFENMYDDAMKIRALILALPARSNRVGPEALKKIEVKVEFAAAFAERLSAAGEAKDQSPAEGFFKRVQSTLAEIEGLYPAGFLKAP